MAVQVNAQVESPTDPPVGKLVAEAGLILVLLVGARTSCGPRLEVLWIAGDGP